MEKLLAEPVSGGEQEIPLRHVSGCDWSSSTESAHTYRKLIIVKSIDTIQVGHTYVYLFIIICLQHPHNELFDVFELVGGILGQYNYRY